MANITDWCTFMLYILSDLAYPKQQQNNSEDLKTEGRNKLHDSINFSEILIVRKLLSDPPGASKCGPQWGEIYCQLNPDWWSSLTAAAASGKCPHAENNPLHRLLMERPKLVFGPEPRTRVSSVAMQNWRADSWARILIDHSGAYRNVECGEVNGKGKSYRERAWRAVCVLSHMVLKDGHGPWRTQEMLKRCIFLTTSQMPSYKYTGERETTNSIYSTTGVYQHQHSCIRHVFYRKHVWRRLAAINPHGKYNCSTK